MELSRLKIPISTFAAPVVIAIFCAFLVLSVSRFPAGFSPLHNWISDLGNTNLNPEGAAIFNSGCMIAGIPVVAFYVGLYKWYTGEPWRDLMVGIAQVAGAASGLALIMVGHYPEIFDQHYMWAGAFFISNFVALLLANAALFTHLRYSLWTGMIGLAAATISAVFIAGQAASADFPLFEWVAVALALAWTAAVAINTYIAFDET